VAEAEEVYREGIRLAPQDPERCEALADFLSDIGREEEAREYYQRARAVPEAGGSGEPPLSGP
jgi:Flp pilus assembly protein TadD